MRFFTTNPNKDFPKSSRYLYSTDSSSRLAAPPPHLIIHWRLSYSIITTATKPLLLRLLRTPPRGESSSDKQNRQVCAFTAKWTNQPPAAPRKTRRYVRTDAAAAADTPDGWLLHAQKQNEATRWWTRGLDSARTARAEPHLAGEEVLDELGPFLPVRLSGSRETVSLLKRGKKIDKSAGHRTNRYTHKYAR